MAYMLKKTLVIGLGGTGRDAALYMKKKLLGTYGEIPPMVKFRVFDTADKQGLKTATGEIGLDPGEFEKLEVRNPTTLVRTSDEIKAWFPREVPLFALSSGAKAIRALGRLAAFANAHKLYQSINSAVSSIRDFRVGRISEKYEITSPNIIVNIVCSLAGGTGSGCFFDVAVIARHILKDEGKLVGYLLLPDVFVGKPATQTVEPNAYAAIKETEYFFDLDIRRSITYRFGGSELKVDGALFNFMFVVNNVNKIGVEYSEVTDLTEFLGTGMLLMTSATGKGMSDILDNAEAQSLVHRWFHKPTVFCSFGLSELYYPGEWFADLYAKQIALGAIRKVLAGGQISQVGEAVESFIDRVDLREDTADEVIDAILAPTDFRKFPLPQDFTKETLQQTFARREAHLNAVRRDVSDVAQQAVAKLRARYLETLREYLKEATDKPHGVEFARSFLKTLTTRLREFKNMMVTERDTLAKQEADLQGKYEAAKADAERATKRLFGARGAIEESVKKYKSIVDKHSSIILEKERHERSIELFTHIIDDARTWLEKLDSLANYAEALDQELSQEIQKKRLEKKAIKPFMHEVMPAGLKEWKPTFDPTDFLIWLAQTKQMRILDLATRRLEEVKSLLLEYGYSRAEVQEIREKRIEDILKDLREQERGDLIRLLDEMAAPLWRYDEARISGDKKTENIYLFGVETIDDTVFTAEKIEKMISSQFEPFRISTGDSKRVVCFKVEVAVPAFCIAGMAKYRERFMAPDRPFSYHIHKDWERDFPDLLPSEEESSRRYWSVGLADPFNLISRKGEYYYVRSERRGERTKDYLVQLAQGRTEAMKTFLSDPDLVTEVREEIEKITLRLGNERVTESLKAYIADIEQKGKRQTESIRNQIEVELKDVDDFINDLSSLA